MKLEMKLGVVLCMIALVAGAEDLPLRLIPFPREVKETGGLCDLAACRFLVAGEEATLRAGRSLVREFERELEMRPALKTDGAMPAYTLVVGEAGADLALELPSQGGDEAYALEVTPSGAVVRGRGMAGLRHGVQTLRQLLYANRRGTRIPTLSIRDYPALKWRGFQDDITRGPSPKLDTLTREVDLAELTKQNFFTYYLEYQYAYPSHPNIGPEDGSFTPEELTHLVDYAAERGVEILGCQQAFGHMGHIVQSEAYAHLAENHRVLTPAKEETYTFLDDLFGDQIPHLDCELFNVCCDEVGGLGEGPAQAMVEKLGTGAVYARHMNRVHELVSGEYGKRMMMWGDIILKHPEQLDKIPQDTVMLTWAYSAWPNYDKQIIPFAESGYDFFVCPGVSGWRRLIPDLSVATTNIRNFVRDGVEHGAMGMLNTSWDDTGDNFNAVTWHGLLWGAECAWNASTTPLDAFNRRAGGVLFGEPGDHFGQAIELLAQTHALAGMEGMNQKRFWNLAPTKCTVSEEVTLRQARALKRLIEPALDHLRQAQSDARRNADLLDYFIYEAKRMQLIADRDLGFLDALDAYRRASRPGVPRDRTQNLVAAAGDQVKALRDRHQALKDEYIALWHRENKPYALSRPLGHFDGLLETCDDLVARFARALDGLASGEPLPSPRDAGLEIEEPGVRNTEPVYKTAAAPFASATWAAEGCSRRFGIEVHSGKNPRQDYVVETELHASMVPRMNGATLYEIDPESGAQRPIPHQMLQDDSARLVFRVDGRMPEESCRSYYLYCGEEAMVPVSAPGAVLCSEITKDRVWIENDLIRILIGAEGAHIYRWEVRELDHLDLTHPGESAWSGFADLGRQLRVEPYDLELVADGPLLVRVRATTESGAVKIIDAFAGVPWVRVSMIPATGWYWNYDLVDNFAADRATPGRYLFSDGKTGPVGRAADAIRAQIKSAGVRWSAKTRDDGLLLALITPGQSVEHTVGPGAGSGGVGVQIGNSRVSHVINVGGMADRAPQAWLDDLERTWSLEAEPEIVVYRDERINTTETP
ncbi:glycoside hydrolase family 20 zincin-like fold domain-containing protein [Kiritimatiella glycovorans]|uniref:beta-N-acetylhexosaminidase n=1 Tax=Kiritimatiella glycovorans TaxID=1307763 RepID=A0A0G3EDY5_9BACT|nr:glycoside hydrolase family 20 zincin-like fold domain-containing protein [Kiritimatiella glycovorans]AKJ64671.1 Beta-hexosaminidase [Kiritimatiella glycovorans]